MTQSRAAIRRRDPWLLALAALALGVEATFLAHQLRLVRLPFLEGVGVDSRPAVGSVVSKQRSVSLRAPGSLTWYPVSAGDALRPDDTVMTGAKAEARLTLKDQGELSLGPDTLVRLTSQPAASGGEAVLSLEVNQGQVRVRAKKPVTIKVRNSQLALEAGSEAVLDRAPTAAASQVKLEQGQGVITGPQGPAVSLEQGQAVQVSAVAPPEPVKVSLESAVPPRGKRFVADPVGQVEFRWDGEEGDALELSANSQFQPSTRRGATGHWNTELAPGRYFWRVHRKGVVSEPNEFIVEPKAEYEVRGPASGAQLSRKSPVKLAWEALPGAASYRVEVADSAVFEKLVMEQTVEGPSASLGVLPPGRYFWRITAQGSGWGAIAPSEARSFVIKAPLGAPKTKGAKVLPEKPLEKPPKGGFLWWKRRTLAVLRAVGEWLLPSAHASRAVYLWEFAWESIPGAESYRLEVSSDRHFKRVVEVRKTEDTAVTLELPGGTTYYWRVAGVDEDGEIGRFSRVQIARSPRPKPVVVARAPAEAPPAPPRASGVGWLLPSWVRVGAAASFISQSSKGTADNLSASGLPMGRWEGTVHRAFRDSELEVGGWFQRLRFETRDVGIAEFQPDLTATAWGAHLLYKGLLRWGQVPVTAGLSTQRAVDLYASGPETAQIRTVGTHSVLLGLSPWQGADGGGFWQTDLLLEGMLLGEARGAGLWLRGRYGFWNFVPPFTLEFQLMGRPGFRKLSTLGRSQFTLELAGALVLGGLFDDSPRWASR